MLPSQGARLMEGESIVGPVICKTGQSPFLALHFKRLTIVATYHHPSAPHRNFPKKKLMGVKNPFFIRHYLKNPLGFIFLHILICLNLAGNSSWVRTHLTGDLPHRSCMLWLQKYRIQRSYIDFINLPTWVRILCELQISAASRKGKTSAGS